MTERRVLVSPSILSADFANLEHEIEKISAFGADFAHVDVMDGHFVPNLTIGAPVVKALKKISAVPLDVHLMISRPDIYLDDFLDAGADILTVHLESNCDAAETLKRIRARGVKAGLSIKPGTPASEAYHLLDKADILLIMTVEPGFGGQKFIPETLPKIREARDYINENNLECVIEIDGGVTCENAGAARENGAVILVAGSAVFGAPDMKEAIDRIRG